MSVVPVKLSHEIERMERLLSVAMGAVPHDPAAAIAALEQAIALARSSPEAAEWFVPAELLGELADEYEAAGRPDEALAAMHEAIEEGWSGRPDGRCRLAEILLRCGRVGDATRLWAEVRADQPDDGWLYSSAGVAYATAGDHATAVEWLTDGLRLAVRTGDPDDLAEPLLEQRAESLAALGRPADELQSRAEDFLQTSPVRAEQAARSFPALAPVSPARAFNALSGPTGSRPVIVGQGSGTGSGSGAARGGVHAAARWAWFPAEDYPRALRLWPELTDEGGPAARGCDHALYSRRMQSRIREGAGALMVGVAIAPIRIEAYLSWCATRGEDPARARASYAAAMPPDDLIAWPPGRNDACWCGSTRKYKRCCGLPGELDT